MRIIDLYTLPIMHSKLELDKNQERLNVNGYKDYNHLHVHPKAIVSGSFYCKVPEKSGPLRFLVNKDIPLFVSDEYIDTFNKYNSSWFDIFPTEFDTLFFPSWIQHEVRPNMNKKEKRITISFNFS